MAIRARADILLIDEVLAVGDADFQRKCFNYFDQLRNKNVTVIFVSHDMDAVREYCDRAILIENSKIVAEGTSNKVAQEYLKLFAAKDAHGSDLSDQDRWGDRTVYLERVELKIEKDFVVITQSIKANQPTASPIPGLRIKDASGKDITGTNTRIEDLKLPNMSKGSVIEVEFKFPNILRDGEYTLDVAILHSDGITVADWWNDASAFEVRKGRHLPYSIDPGFKVKVTPS
jgi:ABC-type multidrug transport system ATPase subunit